MGTRKKTNKHQSNQIIFINRYKALSINERIAFKYGIFRTGRSRICLFDLLTQKQYWVIGANAMRNYILYGYDSQDN